MEFTPEVARGAWIRPRLEGWGVVGGTVPRGFEAYARVFHPARTLLPSGPGAGTDPDERRESWASVAHRFGRAAHPAMQWVALVGTWERQLELDGGRLLDAPDQGELPLDLLAELAELLAAATTTADDAVAAIWHGFGQLRPESTGVLVLSDGPLSPDERRTAEEAHRGRLVASVDPRVTAAVDAGPTLSLPGREHVLLSCSVVEFADPGWTTASGLGWAATDRHGITPNLLWPEDRAWCLASEIDFDSTLVGGSRALVDAILASPMLEAAEVGPDTDLSYRADSLNPAPPAP